MEKFQFKQIGKCFINGIDNLNILKKAFKVLYYVFGIIIGIAPLFIVWLGAMYLGSNFNIADQFVGYAFNGWSKFVFWLMVAIFVVLVIFMFYVCYGYWKKHGDDFGNSTSKYPNVSFAADFIHTFNSTSVFISVFSITAFGILAYLFCALTGEYGFYHDANFIKYLFAVVIGILIYALAGLLSIMFVGFFTESLKLFVQIGTDLRDVADIMRSSEILVEESDVKEQQIITETINKD